MALQNTDQQLVEYTAINLIALKKLALFFVHGNTGSYHNSIGGHIRHIIEHYDALVFRNSSQINYDLRKRDELLESSPTEAVERIEKLVKQLNEYTILEIEESIEVSCVGGSNGEYLFSSQSTVGRELFFLNSHCVHHLAIIKPICKQFEIPLDEHFGYAPSTIAYLESQKLEV